MKKPTKQSLPPLAPPRPSLHNQNASDSDEESGSRASVDIAAVTRALGLSFLSGAAGADDDSSSSSSSSESDSSDEEHDANEEEAEAAKQRRREERAKQREREKLQRRFIKKLQSRSELDGGGVGATGGGSSRGAAGGGSSSALGGGGGGSSSVPLGFPSLASTAILKFKRSSGGGGNSATARAMRTLHGRGDPFLIGESQSLSSEEEEEEKPNYGTMATSTQQQQRKAAAAAGATSSPSVPGSVAVTVDRVETAAAFAPELGLLSSATRLRAQSSAEYPGTADADIAILETLRQSHVQRVRSTSDAGTRQPLSPAPTPSQQQQQQQHHQQEQQQQQPRWLPPDGGRAFLGMRLHRHSPLSRLWGKINNSYFAYWLVVGSVAVLALDILAIVFVRHAFHSSHGDALPDAPHRTGTGMGDVADAACDWRLQLLRWMHLVGIPNVLLVLPVLCSSECFALYTRTDRRIVRRPYLQFCELLVTAQVAFMLYFAVDQALNLPETVRCHKRFTASEIAMLYSSLVMWAVLMRQIVLFCRFITHQKLQADGANDANHTSAMNAWLKRMMSWPGLSKRSRSAKAFKKALYRAVVRGDVDLAQRLLEDAREVYGITCVRDLYRTPVLWCYAFAQSSKNPLHVAAMQGDPVMVQLLLLHGFDVNALDKVSRIRTQDGLKSPLKAVLCTVLLPPLHGAVASGHVNVVRLLLEHGADVNALTAASFYYPAGVLPPIFVADDPQVLQLLVAHGANFLHVARVSLAGLMQTFATPLQRAAFTMRASLSDYLVECGADVALTPLHSAAAAGHVATVKQLLAHGTHVDTLGERVRGVHLRTPLHWAAVVGELAAAQLLLRKGADPNAPDRDGRTPLHWAAHNDHPEMVALLLASGADPNAQDAEGSPILCFAAEAEGVSAATIASLVSAGASLKFKVATGDTALHIALQRENRQTALSLIKCGANMMATNSVGKRPVDCTTSTELQFTLKKEAGSRDVMISYTHTHFEFAQRVREYLEGHCALTCWMDTMDPSGIGGGAVWREEIARGIQKCSVVLSLVCDGYTKSEWCLKELALAKNIRKPVVGLIVEEGSKASMAPLEPLVPVKNRILFNDFIVGKRQDGRRVLFDVNELAFTNKLQAVLPVLRAAMGAERRVDQEEKELLAHAKSERFKLRQMTTVVEDFQEEEDDDDAPEYNVVERHGVALLQRLDSAPEQCVRVYSYAPEDPFALRVATELTRFGLSARPLDPASLREQLSACRCVVLVVPNFQERDKHARKQIAAALTEVVQAARSLSPRKRVVPVFETRHFLDLSKMYSLARSEFFYFTDGVGKAHSKAQLIVQLRRCVGR
ncbi:hypothetical protein PybrP1_008051 [[Pythium] brassicae (nom. inval.)]|nr:hypothetical protein PybrP1_008051 [[Pythium] brassicae (nom. inval.)]